MAAIVLDGPGVRYPAMGRETLHEYAANELDLVRVQQKNGASSTGSTSR
jgi:hypothetical protein